MNINILCSAYTQEMSLARLARLARLSISCSDVCCVSCSDVCCVCFYIMQRIDTASVHRHR